MDRAGMTHVADSGETVLAYAVLEAGRPFRLPAIRGPLDADLETREVTGLRVVYSRLPPRPAAPDHGQLRAFYEVIERLHARYDILPLRWGQYFSDPQALTCALAADADPYLKRLARLVGATEMGIRFLSDRQAIPEDTSQPPPESRGRAFLEQRRARYGLDAAVQARRQRVEETCRSSFAGLFREAQGRDGANPRSRFPDHDPRLLPDPAPLGGEVPTGLCRPAAARGRADAVDRTLAAVQFRRSGTTLISVL